MSPPIEFYFDFSSPYGYLASHRIDHISERHHRTTVWRPILLALVFKATGGAPLSSSKPTTRFRSGPRLMSATSAMC